MKRILVYGWFGENNYGDELLLKSIQKIILSCEKRVEINVMGANPKQIRKNHKNINRVSKTIYIGVRKIASIIIKDPVNTIINLRNNDVLIVAGGGAISDWNSASTKEMFFLINYFYRHHKKIYLLGVGAGPIQKKQSYERFLKVLSKSNAITTRDEYSYEELKKIGLNNVKIGMDLSYYSGLDNNMYCYSEKIKRIGIVLAPVCMNTKELYKEFVREIKKMICELTKRYEVSLIPFQYNYDKVLLDSIIGDVKDINVLYDPENVWTIEKYIADQDLIIGMRYHSLILSIMLKKFVIPIVYHPKDWSFCEDFFLTKYSESIGNGENWKYSNISSERILRKIEQIENDDKYKCIIDEVLLSKKENGLEQEIVKKALEE